MTRESDDQSLNLGVLGSPCVASWLTIDGPKVWSRV